jgi:hypothetical protein
MRDQTDGNKTGLARRGACLSWLGLDLTVNVCNGSPVALVWMPEREVVGSLP